jgi:hypothetical protein
LITRIHPFLFLISCFPDYSSVSRLHPLKTARSQLLHASLNPPSSLNFQGMASGESRGMHPPLPLRLDGSKHESLLTAGDKNSAPIDSKD